MKFVFLFCFLINQILVAKAFSEQDCERPLQTKSCKLGSIRYHWNHHKQECEKDMFFGCGETPNNFKTLEECLTVAKPICTQ
ncbi:unnamed protein product [Brassicogethes aeneus]|uniref:BPTI/Kunitz inhibitor domain-containing protein n=1 Tax=Brassicogethes aeneus TaxID=1431903 RepID=A0A9P0B6U6_BRAAE|nr:unnamed protein product [Brassicogethes aeneus]